MKELHKNYIGIAAAAMVTLGMASSALAAPVFTVDPSGLGASQGPYQANFMGGTSSTMLTSTAGGVGVGGHTGSGWIQFTSFNLDSNPVGPLTTGLGSSYGLFLTFTLSDVLYSDKTRPQIATRRNPASHDPFTPEGIRQGARRGKGIGEGESG